MRVGIIGTTSLIGQCLISIIQSLNENWEIISFSRKEKAEKNNLKGKKEEWRNLTLQFIPDPDDITLEKDRIEHWVSLTPIWALPECFQMLIKYGAKRVVALSSTSRYTKIFSSSLDEQKVAEKLTNGEKSFISWSEENGIDWVVLRPTLIYGLGRDRTLSEIIHFIKRFAFFPLLGSGMGLRQPVHVEDVALSCISALKKEHEIKIAYNISGGEILSYREMISRVFALLEMPTRFVTVPHWVFCWGFTCLSLLPRFRNWSIAMAERMNQDMVFDHAEAARDLGFSPRAFVLSKDDIPK